MKPLVIIHGWSDSSDSFLPLAKAIESHSGRVVNEIWLGNYISLDDDVQMNDLVRGLDLAWHERGLPIAPKSVDVVIHSTGGLIIRDWMYTNFVSKAKKTPVNNLVMLAPANFGSPLAHKGRAFYGRVIKGFNSRKRFETGTQILKSLEMASPYSWKLALNDCFLENVFSLNDIRATVIVGNTGYGGISSLANENGSDGTVYVSTANLNCSYLKINFPSLPKIPEIEEMKPSKGKTAFLVVDNCNHSSIALKEENDKQTEILNHIVTALEISDETSFEDWMNTCRNLTSVVMDDNVDDGYKHGYQNTVFRVKDDQGFYVTDYVVEFYQDANKGVFDRVAELFNNKVVSNVHVYKDNPAYRSFMIDCTALKSIINEEDENLRISISAMPDINDKNTVVGYRTFEDEDMGSLNLGPNELDKFFKPNRTVFIDITLMREQKENLFTIDRVQGVN